MTEKKAVVMKGVDGSRTFTDAGIRIQLVGSFGSYVADITNTHETMKLVIERSAVSQFEVAPGETKRNYWDKLEQWRKYFFWHEEGPVLEVLVDAYGSQD